jgi:hypothetical protein
MFNMMQLGTILKPPKTYPKSTMKIVLMKIPIMKQKLQNNNSKNGYAARIKIGNKTDAVGKHLQLSKKEEGNCPMKDRRCTLSLFVSLSLTHTHKCCSLTFIYIHTHTHTHILSF